MPTSPSSLNPSARPLLAMIGAGNMGGAIVRGAIATGVLAPGEILVVEPDASRRSAMAALGVRALASPGSLEGASTLLLAVKPQYFAEAAAALPRLPAATVVISIMAGLDSTHIRSALGGEVRVVRAMPNTPCQVGAGMTAIALGAGAVPGDEALAVRLFAAIGSTEVVDEALMHAVTAVSGSGPAYLFHLAEAMEAAARSLGFSGEQARRFVTQTLLGASRLLAESADDPARLRQAVTSKGGTTEAALGVMASRGFAEIVAQALTAARDRGAALARGNAPDAATPGRDRGTRSAGAP